MAVTDYTSLQSHMADVLVRPDLTSQIQQFIKQAEEKFIADPRVRRKVVSASFVIDAESVTLPNQLKEIQAITHNGSTYYHPLSQGTVSDLAAINLSNGGQSGAPEMYSRTRTSIRVAPPPDQSYTMVFEYWETIPKLSDTVLSNWMLEQHSGIYVAATALEAAPFLREDERLATWETIVETGLDRLHLKNVGEEYSGPLSRGTTVEL